MGFEDVFERMRKRIRELIEEFELELESAKSMWSPDGAIEPLYTINAYHDRYEILIDLPYSDLDSLSAEIRDNKLVIKCKLREELEFSSWFGGRGVKFERYYTEIRLPRDIVPSGISIEKDALRKIVKIVVYRRK